MIKENDWRLRGQKKYLCGITLQWKKYTQYRPGWDHDHCAFCWSEFSEADEPSILKEGYATEDDYHWVCKQCYEDFKEMFQWKLRESGESVPGTGGTGCP